MDKHIPARLAVGIDDAACMLSVSRRHVYDLFELGKLSNFKSGRRRLIRVSELERYIAERESETA